MPVFFKKKSSWIFLTPGKYFPNFQYTLNTPASSPYWLSEFVTLIVL